MRWISLIRLRRRCHHHQHFFVNHCIGASLVQPSKGGGPKSKISLMMQLDYINSRLFSGTITVGVVTPCSNSASVGDMGVIVLRRSKRRIRIIFDMRSPARVRIKRCRLRPVPAGAVSWLCPLVLHWRISTSAKAETANALLKNNQDDDHVLIQSDLYSKSLHKLVVCRRKDLSFSRVGPPSATKPNSPSKLLRQTFHSLSLSINHW